MSTTLYSFNLTDYTDLRSLEFEYSKLQDENQTLKFKLETIEDLYRRVIKQSQQKEKISRERQTYSKGEEVKLKQSIQEILDGISHIKGELLQLDKLGINCGLSQSQNVSEIRLESAASELSTILNVLLSLMNHNSQLSLNYSKQIQTLKTENRIHRKNEQDFKEEIAYLSQEISKLEKINATITHELNLIRRENSDLKLKVYEFAQDTEHSVSRVQDQAIEDNNFTVDLLHFQKEILEKTFEKTISAIQNQSISSILNDIYASCESVSEIFREKLQIQYDLQDLEQQYKREKNSKVSEKLLIELRKQIEEFRSELQKQRELLGKEEMNLQELFLVLRATDKEQKMARNYAVDIQKQLQRIKENREGEEEESSTREVKAIKQTKRNSQDSSVRESSRIRFKISQNEEAIREALEKDRENIEKMFKQTRRNYLKQLE